MQTILGKQKRNIKTIRLFSLLKKAPPHTQKKRETLFLFLSRVEIATRRWLIVIRSLEGGNSYQTPSRQIIESKRIEIKLQMGQGQVLRFPFFLLFFYYFLLPNSCQQASILLGSGKPLNQRVINYQDVATSIY